MNGIFARKVIVIHKNGFRIDYTHVTEFKAKIPVNKEHQEELGPVLLIKGETYSELGGFHDVIDTLKIKDLHMTIIDWYVPEK